MEVSIDVADAIQAALNEAGHSASAIPLPGDFEGRLPFTRVEVVGGTRSQLVLDQANVHLDTWADTHAGAVRESSAVAAELAGMAGSTLGGSQLYSVTLASLPYEAADADHPSLPMASFMAQVTVRTRHID